VTRGGAARALLLLTALVAPPAAAQQPPTEQLPARGIVWHFSPAGERLAARLAEVMAGAPPLPGLPPDVLAEPVHVYLAEDERAFARLSGGSPPEWGAGIAVLGDTAERIVLPAYATERLTPAELPRVLRHELAHVALHRYLGDARVPRWFHEGYARWVAGELDFEAAWQLRLAFATGRAPPLDSLALDWPAARLDAGVAYLLAASTIDYLVAEGGVRGLTLMLERWRESGDLDSAMRRTYGVTVAQFEEDWRKHVRARYGWALVLTHSAVFWAIAAVLLIVLVFRRKRRDRARLDRMAQTDPPDDPDWWNPRSADATGAPRSPAAEGHGAAPGAPTAAPPPRLEGPGPGA